MSEQESNIYPEIRIKKVDDILEENAKEVASLMGVNMTEEEKEYLDAQSESLERDLQDVQEVIQQTLKYLEERGCDVWQYLKK